MCEVLLTIRRRFLISSFLLTCQLSATPMMAQENDSKHQPPVAKEISNILTTQAAAWNRGDIDAFMTAYWNSEKLSFSSGGKTTRGWKATRDGYKRRYSTREKMGRLTFSQLEVNELGDGAALVLGRWKLKRTTDQPGGNFSLVFRKLNGKWMIIHDHTSLLKEDKTPEQESKEKKS